MKLTARLSKPGVQITRLMKNDHNLRGPIVDWADIVGSELYYGTSYADLASWSGFVAAGTRDNLGDLRNQGAAAIIFIPVQNRYIIFLFGYGGHQLSGLGLETDFGLKVVLNTVNPDRIRSVDSKTIDTLVINKRTQLSKEKEIKEFGFAINKDFLKQLVGKPTDTNFASSIAGSDSLILGCEVSTANIHQKAIDIFRHYNSTNYKRNYRWFDNIKYIKDKTLINQLDNSLLAELNDLLQGSNSDIQLACPTIIDYELVDHYRIRGYRSTEEIDFLDIEALIADMQNSGINSITEDELDSYKIHAIDAAGATINYWNLKEWLIFETTINPTHYFLSEGDWYEVSRSYFRSVNRTFTDILSNADEYRVLAITPHQTERDYLADFPIRHRRHRVFDQDETYIYGGRNAVEICDIYNSDREFIHVKEGGASSKLSHLFNQGYVSASLFLNDVNFRDDIVTKLQGQRTLINTINNPVDTRNYSVVYRIIKKGPQFTLPFFSKIVLQEMHSKITSMGYRFRLEWVPKN